VKKRKKKDAKNARSWRNRGVKEKTREQKFKGSWVDQSGEGRLNTEKSLDVAL